MWAAGNMGAAAILVLGLALAPVPVAMADDGTSIEAVDPTAETGEPTSAVGGADQSTESESAAIATDLPSAATPDDPAEGRVVVEVQEQDTTEVGTEDPEDATDAAPVTTSAVAPPDAAQTVGGDVPPEGAEALEGGSHEEPDGHDPGEHPDPGTHEEPDGHDPGEHPDPGTHDDPDGHDSDHGGQPARLSCSEIDPTWVELELKGHPISGTYAVGDDFRTVQFAVLDATAGGKYVNWSADGPIDAVILRSGQDAATYEYEPAAFGDTGLLPPLKDRDGRNLSSVLACYDPAEAVVGIDLFLADSDDPVEVGDTFDYVVAVDTTAPLTGAEITITLAPEVDLADAGSCLVEGDLLRCQPPLDSVEEWQATISVEAVAAGNAITRADLAATAGDEEVLVSAVEVTRVIGPPGSGGCGGHDDGGDDGHDDGHEPGHEPGGDDDECPGAARSLLEACAAFDPQATALVLPGPFANRQYLIEGADGVRIWVTVGEGTGVQAATWEANVPIDVVFTRTGQDVAEFPYSPAAMSGDGILGPPGGSGKPRPMADMAFCWVERAPVDVSVIAAGPSALLVGGNGVVEVTVRNRGYATADPISLRIRASEHVGVTDCSGPLGCALTLGPGEETVISIAVTGRSAGLAEIVADAVVPAEPPALGDDNTAVVEFVVDAVAADVPGSSPPDEVVVSPVVIAAEELPETGPVDALWLLLAGTALIALGSRLVRFGTAR